MMNKNRNIVFDIKTYIWYGNLYKGIPFFLTAKKLKKLLWHKRNLN